MSAAWKFGHYENIKGRAFFAASFFDTLIKFISSPKAFARASADSIVRDFLPVANRLRLTKCIPDASAKLRTNATSPLGLGEAYGS
jgi:hypothetical protein